MAVMVPPQPFSDTKSNAERRIFERIRTGLSDEWIGLHSLGVGTHPHKDWAEIDFVLIGPPGVFCLEVKGGRVSRDDNGTWRFTNAKEETNTSRRGPWEQVAPAAVQLRNYLRDEDEGLSWLQVGHGVVMPDITFMSRGPDIVTDVLYDDRDSARGFAKYVERLAKYWSERNPGKRGLPDQAIRTKVLHLLRGRFDRRPSLRWIVKHVDEELLRLTEEQYDLLDALADNERTLVQGGAGTGKTLLAVQEARRMAAHDQTVLYVCYNVRLASWIAQQPELKGVEVTHLHGLMRQVVEDAGLSWRVPEDAGEDDKNQVFLPEAFLEAVLEYERGPTCDCVIIDEAQDLMSDAYLNVIDAVLKRGLMKGQWCAFYDPKQDVFSGMRPKGLSRLMGLSPARFRLTKNCRNTIPIAVTTALLSGTDADAILRAEGPEVSTLWYRDQAEQRRVVSKEIGRLLGEQLEPAQITILGPQKLSNCCLKDGLELKSCTLSDKAIGAPQNAVHYATIQSFKGLEADTVILVDVDRLETEEAARRMYTAASRARVYLAVVLSESVRDEYGQRAREYGERAAAGLS